MRKRSEKTIQNDKLYTIKNRDKRLLQQKQYYTNNKESYKKRAEMNKDKLKVYNKNYSKLYYKKNRLFLIEAQLKNKYGITKDQYNELFNKQNGCCAICGRHQSMIKKTLAVDHNHETNEIRGLLCQSCNLILGHANDNIDVLKNAIKYII